MFREQSSRATSLLLIIIRLQPNPRGPCFSFTVYSPDMPSRLPVQDIFAGLVTSIGTAIRYWFHYTLVAFAWLGVVPLTACKYNHNAIGVCVSTMQNIRAANWFPIKKRSLKEARNRADILIIDASMTVDTDWLVSACLVWSVFQVEYTSVCLQALWAHSSPCLLICCPRKLRPHHHPPLAALSCG